MDEGVKKRKWKWIGIVCLIIAAAPTLLFVLGHLIVFLWGYTISDIFGVKEITFWQALALLLLLRILFGDDKAHFHKTRVRKGCQDERQA